jgi:hypothetical protein
MSNIAKPVTSSLNQGAQFADMTKTMHGGSRKNLRKNKKMGSAQSKRSKGGSRRSRSSRKTRRQSGGSFFTPYADYSTEFDQQLPADMRALSGVGPLDAKFVELPAIERAAGVMMGGGYSESRVKEQARRSAAYKQKKKLNAEKQKRKEQQRRSKKQRQKGGSAPVDEPSMLLRTPTEEMDARLNPQWYTENTVVPNFQGPIPVPGGTVPAPSNVPIPKVGGRRRF